jgi:hypothetical protein
LPIGDRALFQRLDQAQRRNTGEALMLVYLSFLVCTAAGSCHVTVPEERPFMGLASCQVDGMLLTPAWEAAHAGWHVTKVRCTLGSRPKTDEQA